MQGNRTSEQQGKICLTHGARASAPNQALTALPGTRASTPRPQPDRLPEPYIPTDEDLLQRIVQQPLLTFAELLLQLWPSLPYRALPGQDSATETKRRWPAPAGGAPQLLQTAAGWLRTQLRRLHRAGHIELQSYPDGVCYLPAGLALLHRPAPIRVLEYLTREEVDLCPTTGCISAPDDLDLDQPWAKVRVRRSDQMTLVAYRSGAGTAQRVHKPLYPIGEHVAGPILVPSDADHPRIWRLCLVLTPRRSGGSSSCAHRSARSAPARTAPGVQAPGRRTAEPFTLLPLPATAATRPEQARLARVAAAPRAGRGPCVDLVSLPTTALATVLDFGAYAKEHRGAARLEVGHA
jgi:hypothetical protein